MNYNNLCNLSIDEIFTMLFPKMTDFVPYIDNNLSFLENKNKEYIAKNLLTEVTL